MQAVFVAAPDELLGTVQRVRITAAPGNSLAARLIADNADADADEVAGLGPDEIAGLGADEVAA